VALVMALLPGGASATSPDGLTDAEAAQFVLVLQEAVRADAPRAVAALIAFPLRVNGAKGPSRIPNADVFVRRYRTIFTDSVRTAVLAQTLAQVFRNWRGGMIGNGELWFAGVCANAHALGQPGGACPRSRVAVIAVNSGR
jgi:hypothetical protein